MKSERRRSPRLSLSIKIMPVLGLPSLTGKGSTLPGLGLSPDKKLTFRLIKLGEKDLSHPRYPCFRPGLRTTVLAVGTSILPFLALATTRQLNIY